MTHSPTALARLSLLVALPALPLAGEVEPAPLVPRTPHDVAPSAPPSPVPQCGQREILASLGAHVDRVRSGQIQVAAPPVVAPRTSYPAKSSVPISPDDFFLYEDTDAVLAGGLDLTAIIELMVEASNALMVEHGDNFDFIGFFTAYEVQSLFLFYMPVLNDVLGLGDSGVGIGTGEPIFDLHADLGLAGTQTEGMLMFFDVNATWWVLGDGEDAALSRLLLAHETEHRFGIDLKDLPNGLQLQGDNMGCGTEFHWNPKVDGQGSALGLSEWVGEAPAVFASTFGGLSFNSDTGGVYSYTDLYLMGFVTPGEMDAGNSELRHMAATNCLESEYFGPTFDFTSTEIIAGNGPRDPVAADEDKHYRIGWVMFHLPGELPDAATLEHGAALLTQHAIDYETSTLGLGSLDGTLPISPAVDAYGCGGNPAGSLTVVAGAPTVGGTLTLGVDNPLGTQGGGSLPLVIASLAPDAAFPCGTLLPGLGMSAPGASGELLLSLADLVPGILLTGPPWSGTPGTPTPVDVPVPAVEGLAGLSVYLQGLLIDPALTFGIEAAFADAFAVVIGT